MGIDKNNLINEAQNFLDDLEKSNPENESLEWYLINNLKGYLTAINTATTTKQIKQATEKLDMFCVDSMNWNAPLFKRCTKITDLGLKLAKTG